MHLTIAHATLCLILRIIKCISCRLLHDCLEALCIFAFFGFISYACTTLYSMWGIIKWEKFVICVGRIVGRRICACRYTCVADLRVFLAILIGVGNDQVGKRCNWGRKKSCAVAGSRFARAGTFAHFAISHFCMYADIMDSRHGGALVTRLPAEAPPCRTLRDCGKTLYLVCREEPAA